MVMKMLMVMMIRTKMMIMRFVVLMVIFAVTNRCSQLANKTINLHRFAACNRHKRSLEFGLMLELCGDGRSDVNC